MTRRANRRGRIARVVALLLLAVLLPAQMGGAVSTANAATARDTTPVAVVVIRNFGFHPAVLSIQHETTVVWINRDSVSHTVTADNGSFSSGVIRPGGVFVHTFNMNGRAGQGRGDGVRIHGLRASRDDGTGGAGDNNPMVVTYHCAIHPFMHGTVIVNS